jgi:hypothetical protein
MPELNSNSRACVWQCFCMRFQSQVLCENGAFDEYMGTSCSEEHLCHPAPVIYPRIWMCL